MATMRIAAALALGLAMLSGCTADATSDGTEVEDATEAAALGPDPHGAPARYAIVLAHGFDASPTNRWGFHGVAEALRADGHVVYVAEVPPYRSVADRAVILASYVEEARADGAEKVNIIAHSMGGLDARYLVSTLGYGDVVASVTTISSPHRGSAVADVALKVLGTGGAPDKVVNALASAWGLSFSDMAANSDVRAALTSLSEANSPAFNAANPDDARVAYQSWAGVSSVLGIKRGADVAACGTILGDYRTADMMNATLVPMAAAVAHGFELRPNDGMATVAGAKWGKFRGCIPADHLDEVGWPNTQKADPRTHFSHIRFYRNVAFELAAHGF